MTQGLKEAAAGRLGVAPSQGQQFTPGARLEQERRTQETGQASADPVQGRGVADAGEPRSGLVAPSGVRAQQLRNCAPSVTNR